MSASSSSSEIAKVRRVIMAYYKKHGRHALPWRKTHDPYKVMVSEIMLQQTQVDRVVPFYERFLKRFPAIEVLAKSDLSEVLKLWSGLGYNRRAKMLHSAAKVVVEKYNRVMPKSREELEGLPGIGSYTAGAIRAFAYNEPEIFIETNIRTVLIHHLFPEKEKVDDKELVEVLKKMADKKSPRDFYAAMMDYGTKLKKEGNATHQRSRQYQKQSAFKGSLREVRGAILKASVKGVSMTSLKKKFGERFEVAKQALKKEGLL